MEESNIKSSLDNTILFYITKDQANTIANYYNKDINDLEDYEICELLNKLIDGVV